MNEEWKTWNFPGIYALRNVTNGKIYIGQAQCLKQRLKTHHNLKKECPYLQKALKSYGWENFEILMLERVDDLALLSEREQFWMDFYHATDRERGYNICPTAGTRRGYQHTEATIDKMRESAKRRPPISEETRAKKSAIVVSQETRAKMSAMRRGKPGRPQSDEHKAKTRATHLGLKHTETACAKMSASHSGQPHPHTAEQDARISEALREMHHCAERTEAILSYLALNPQASNVDIENATGLSAGTIDHLLYQAGWHRQKGVRWEPSTPEDYRAQSLAAILTYLESNPQAGLREIGRATGILHPTVNSLLLRAGWHYERGAGWQKGEAQDV